MIVAYFCLLSQAFPLPLLSVTLFPFGAFAVEEKRCFVDFISCGCFYSLCRALSKGGQRIHVLLSYTDQVRFSFWHAFPRWMNERALLLCHWASPLSSLVLCMEHSFWGGRALPLGCGVMPRRDPHEGQTAEGLLFLLLFALLLFADGGGMEI